MNDFFVFALHNTAVALVLAFFVYGLTRVWHRPPVAHVLWLLVLLKLVAPPVLHVDWAALPLPESDSTRIVIIAEPMQIETSQIESHASFRRSPDGSNDRACVNDGHESARLCGQRSPILGPRGPVVFWFWLAGAVICAAVAAARIVRFERLLRETLPAPERLQRLATEIAGRLGVRRMPRICYVESGCSSWSGCMKPAADNRVAGGAVPPARRRGSGHDSGS